MARPKSQPDTYSSGTRRPNRPQDAALLVRLKTEQLDLLKKAAAIAEADEQKRYPGAKVPVYAFALGAALEKAQEVIRRNKG